MDNLTDEQYVADCGNKCPYCHGEGIMSGEVNVDGKYASQAVKCGDERFNIPGCGKEWYDEFILTGWSPKEE